MGDGFERVDLLRPPARIDAATCGGSVARPEAAANCACVTEHPIRHDPAAPLAFCAILVLNQSYKPFTCGGLWACGQRKALSIKSTASPIR